MNRVAADTRRSHILGIKGRSGCRRGTARHGSTGTLRKKCLSSITAMPAHTKRSARSSPPLKSKPGILRRKRPARSFTAVNKQLKQLKYAVNKNTVRSYGEIQLRRDQYMSSFADQRDNVYDLSSHQPILFCHQSIRAHAPVWQSRYSPGPPGVISVQQVGAFPQQIAPATSYDSTYEKYNQLMAWNNSENVQPKFLLKHVDYTFNMDMRGVEGYIQLVLVTPKRIFAAHTALPPAVQTKFELPYSLPGWINTCVHSDDMYQSNPQYFREKVLKTHYFSTKPRTAVGPTFVQTNSLRSWKVRVRSNAVISVADNNDPAQVYDWSDIPAGKKSFIMVRTSVPPADIVYLNADKRIALQMFRTCCWRDQTGNSGA